MSHFNCHHPHPHCGEKMVYGFINQNGWPYLLGKYLDSWSFKRFSRSSINDQIVVDNTDPSKNTVDISVDFIDPIPRKNSVAYDDLVSTIAAKAERLNGYLDVIRPGVKAIIDFQLESERTGQVLRNDSVTLCANGNVHFLDIPGFPPDNEYIATNYFGSDLKLIGTRVYGTDRLVMRLQNIRFVYESPSYHNHEGNYENPACIPSHGPDKDKEKFYHFTNNGKDIDLHVGSIVYPMAPVTMVAAGIKPLNQSFILNNSYRILFRVSMWKNDVISVSNTEDIYTVLGANQEPLPEATLQEQILAEKIRNDTQDQALSGLQGNIDGVSDEVTAIKGRLDSVEEQLAGLEGGGGTDPNLVQRIEAEKLRNDAQDQNIQVEKNRNDAQDQAIAGLQSTQNAQTVNLSNLTGRVTSLETQVAAMDPSTIVATLTAKIDTEKTRNDNHDAQIATERTRNDTQETNIYNLQVRVGAVETQLAEIGTGGGDNTELLQKIEAEKLRNDTQDTQINEEKTRNDTQDASIDDLKNRVSVLEAQGGNGDGGTDPTLLEKINTEKTRNDDQDTTLTNIQTRLGAVETQLAEIGTGGGDNTELLQKINAEKARNDTQDTQIAAEKTRNDTQDSQINAEKSRNDTQDATLSNLQTRMTTVENQLAAIGSGPEIEVMTEEEAELLVEELINQYEYYIH